MLRVALSRVRHQFGSAALLSLSVAAAVAFIAASFTLGDSIRAGIYQETAAQAANVAAHAEAADTLFTADDVARLRALPGITAVQPRSNSDQRGNVATVKLTHADGSLVSMPGHVDLVAFVAPVNPGLSDHPLAAGRYPTRAGELLVQKRLAAQQHWRPGSTTSVLDTRLTAHSFTIVGIVNGVADDGVVGLLPDEYQNLLVTPDQSGWSAIDVSAKPGLDAVTALRTALGPDATVVTGAEYADDLAAAELGGGVTYVVIGLKLFSWVAVAVALAVAYNTFGIVLAQRQREVALVRCVGAMRGQVFRAVLLEAAAVGLLAAALGYLAGQVLATLAAFLLRRADDAAPHGLTVGFSGQAVAVALAVGLVVALLAAAVPAWVATRVAPVRALSSQAELVESRRLGWLRSGFGVALLAVGLGLAGYSAARHKPWPGIFGGLLVMFSLLALGPIVIGPLARVVGWPGRLAGAAGRLAAANGARQPRRTAAATNALTLGIGLVTVMLVGAASLQTSADAELNDNYPVDFQLYSSANPPNGTAYATLPADLAARLDQTSKFDRPVPIRQRDVDGITAPGGRLGLTLVGAAPADLRAHVPQTAATDGRLGDFTTGTLVLTEAAAARLGHVRAGQVVTVPGAKGSRPLRVAAVIKGGFSATFGGVTISATDFTTLFGAGQPTEILLWNRTGVDASAARDTLDATIVGLPDLSVRDLAEDRAEINSDVNQLLAAGGLMIAMAMVIAVLGVMTTMTLSVFERRREIAVLRALGLTRGQLYATLTIEGAIMAVLAAVIGVALGVALGIAGTYALFGQEDGLLIAVPGGRIALVGLAAALIGMVAALPPARRASRTAPVEALAAA